MLSLGTRKLSKIIAAEAPWFVIAQSVLHRMEMLEYQLILPNNHSESTLCALKNMTHVRTSPFDDHVVDRLIVLES